MSKNENKDTLDLSFETPVDVNSTAYTMDNRIPPTKRRVSYGDNPHEFPSKLPNDPSSGTSSPVTPKQSRKVEVDSPYMDITPEMAKWWKIIR